MKQEQKSSGEPLVAMVSGGSRGIGLSISKRLLADHYRVAILGTRPVVQLEKELDLKRKSGDVCYTQGDLAKEADRARFLADALEAWGRVDCLVNNAGVAPEVRADVLDMREDSYDRVMAVNLKGLVFLSRLVACRMIGQDPRPNGLRGVIINIGSVSADTVSIDRAEYCLSKAGVAMFTQILAVRLADQAIPVFEVRPGVIETDMTKKVKERYDLMIEEGAFPIKRWGQPEDVAAAVSLLASGQLTYVTGECLHIDGGLHIRRL